MVHSLQLTNIHEQHATEERNLDISMRNALTSVGLNFDLIMVSRAGRSQELLICCNDVTPWHGLYYY